MLIMLEGTKGFLGGADHLDPLKFPMQYRELICQQNQIGWRNFLLGRWSRQWVWQQHNSDWIDNTANSWALQLIRCIWDELWELWESRNRDKHGTNAKTRYEAERATLQREITLLYES